jgi:hypothetical protein
MAGAEVIGTAIGVLLLILVGYLLIGSALTTAEVVTSAQKDITIQNEARLQTAISISSVVFNDPDPTTFTLTNTGSEPIKDLNHMDVILFSSSTPPNRFSYDNTGANGWWINPSGGVNPGILDAGENMDVIVTNPGYRPSYVQVICANGVYTYSS